jgi:hypothetical protein
MLGEADENLDKIWWFLFKRSRESAFFFFGGGIVCWFYDVFSIFKEYPVSVAHRDMEEAGECRQKWREKKFEN